MFDLSRLDICFIAGTLGYGGAERQLYYIVSALKANGARVRLLCLTQGEFWEHRIAELGIGTSWVGQRKSRIARLASIIRVLRRDPPAILQSQHFYTNLYAALAARMLSAKGIGAIRSDGPFEVGAGGPVLGRLSLHLPRFIATNSHAAIRYAQGSGISNLRLRLIPNVVDTEVFRPPIHFHSGPVCLLAVGRLGPEKRFDRFLSLLAELKNRHSSQFRAMLVGDGPLRGQLENRAAEMGLIPEFLEFRGTVQDMASIYREADILVITSDSEGTPNVALEAMASGLPIVSTRVGGIPELVRHGSTGFLCDAQGESAMADRVFKLINERQLREEMGRYARQHVLMHHAPGVLATWLRGFYEAVFA